jgi:primosomal protein N'
MAQSIDESEVHLRSRFGCDPWRRLVTLNQALPERNEAEAAGRELAARMRDRAAATNARVAIAGPAPAFVARRGDRWRFNVVLRGDDPVGVLGDPPGAPWSIDVDPESLL